MTFGGDRTCGDGGRKYEKLRGKLEQADKKSLELAVHSDYVVVFKSAEQGLEIEGRWAVRVARFGRREEINDDSSDGGQWMRFFALSDCWRTVCNF